MQPGLVYSFIAFMGILSINDSNPNFRQLNSKTPGHPEYGQP